MSQYWLDMGRAPAEILAEFTGHGVIDTLDVVDDGGIPALYLYGGDANVAVALWNVPGMTIGDCDVIALMRQTSGGVNYQQGICGRMGADRSGYASGAGPDTASHKLLRFDAGARTDLASTTPSVSTFAYHWRRLLIEGSFIRHKVWTGHIVDDQPANWGMSAVDENHAQGGVGLMAVSRAANRDLWVAALAVGTNGDAAPAGPVVIDAPRRAPLMMMAF